LEAKIDPSSSGKSKTSIFLAPKEVSLKEDLPNQQQKG